MYQGLAPGLINGVFQLNLQLPQDVPNPILTLKAAGGSSNPVSIFTK
jgi:uncharacterized protein (TIGR03437 family)